MGVRQRQEAHHGQYGDTTDYFEIYSIYKYIYIPSDTVLWRGFYNIQVSSFDQFRSIDTAEGDTSGMTLIYGNILNAGSAPFSFFFGLFFTFIKDK